MKIKSYQDVEISAEQAGVGIWIDIVAGREKLTLTINSGAGIRFGICLFACGIKQAFLDGVRNARLYMVTRKIKSAIKKISRLDA